MQLIEKVDYIKDQFEDQVILCKKIGRREMINIINKEFQSEITRDNTRSFSISLSERQWDIITDALNEVQKKSQSQIKKVRNFPSETIRSSETIDKHNNIISDIQAIHQAITEGYF